MLCEEVLGNLNDPSYELVLRKQLGGVFDTDELLLDGDIARCKSLHGATARGVEIDFCRKNAAPDAALADGDVLGILPAKDPSVPVVVVVRLKSAKVLLIEVARTDVVALAHACWEVGNMHAPLFRYESDAETTRFITPMTKPLDRMLAAIPGVRVSTIEAPLDPTMRFTTRAAEAVVSLSSDFRIVRKPAAVR